MASKLIQVSVLNRGGSKVIGKENKSGSRVTVPSVYIAFGTIGIIWNKGKSYRVTWLEKIKSLSI